MFWETGRQKTGYRKLLLKKDKTWDAWLLAYPPGIGIPTHIDPLQGRRHLRANLTLLRGGTTLITTAPILRFGPFAIFWSDKPHAVTKGTGRRLVLSLGFAI